MSAIHGFIVLPHHAQFLIALVVLMTLYSHWRFTDVAQAHGPTILTTLGIFSTFLGIAIGLADFDPKNIQSSMPSLLDGIRTAFWASVVGVGGALTIKARYLMASSPKEDDHEDGVNVVDVKDVLVDIRKALVGKDGLTVFSSLSVLNNNLCEKLDKIELAQKKSLEEMSRMGSEALVKGLKDVIRDFNSKITEQFGDNFKELNDAVHKLVDWQNKYKDHIESTTAQMESSVRSMESSVRSMDDAAKHLNAVGVGFKNQMDSSLKSMIAATDEFNNMLAASNKFVGVANGLSGMLDSINKQNNLLNKLVNVIKQDLPLVYENIEKLTVNISGAFHDNQSKLNEALKNNSDNIKKSLIDSAGEMSRANKQFNDHLLAMTNNTDQQIQKLDAALSEELNKSLGSLGQQLTALSGKFVEDYLPLTNKLQELVSISKKIP